MRAAVAAGGGDGWAGSGGRERASVTVLAVPGVWVAVIANSEMKASWRCWKCSQERFVISEKEKRMALKVIPEVEEGGMNSKQLPIKGGVMALCRGKFGGVKGKGEPVTMVPLLKHSTNVRVGSVSGETDGGGWIGMGEESGLGKCRFSSLEGGVHRRSPVVKAGGALKSISEGLEETGGVRKETAVEINEAKETLRVLNGLWLGVV